MVIFVKYHIDKDYFIKHKKEFRKILHKPAYDAIVMRFEKGMSYREIAEHLHITSMQVRKVLSIASRIIRNNGYKI